MNRRVQLDRFTASREGVKEGIQKDGRRGRINVIHVVTAFIDNISEAVYKIVSSLLRQEAVADFKH